MRRIGLRLVAQTYGVRRQSEAATALWIDESQEEEVKTIQSGVALRLPPPSKRFPTAFD
jgi:hypothetical protein